MFQDREDNLQSFQDYLGSEGQAGDGEINYNNNVETIQFS